MSDPAWEEDPVEPDLPPPPPGYQPAPNGNGHDYDANVWADPLDFELVRHGGAQLGPQHVPAALWPFIRDTAERMGVAASSVALASIVACAAVISEEWLIQPKRRDYLWTEAARLWGAIVGPPSVLKSPVIRACTKPIVDLEMAARRMHGEATERYRVQVAEWKAAGKPDPEPRAPRRVRHLVESTTVEALQEVLRDDSDAKFASPLGKVLILQDELGEFLGNMDRYAQGRGGDRGAYLRIYNGGPFTVDRIGRGSFTTKSWSACLLGGIQPDVIQKIAKETTDDGLLQRFIFDVPVEMPGVGADRAPDYAAVTGYRDLLAALSTLHPARSGDNQQRHVVTVLHEDAHEESEEVGRLIIGLLAMESSRVRSTAGKWAGTFARLCLTFHLIEIAGAMVNNPGGLGPVRDVVSVETAERVRRYMTEILAPNLLRADAMIFNTEQTSHAGWVAGYILANQLYTVTSRDIFQHYKTIRPPEERRAFYAVMEALEAFGWVEPMERRNPVKPPAAWHVNPLVHVRFRQRAVVERLRREEARKAIERYIADRRAAEEGDES